MSKRKVSALEVRIRDLMAAGYSRKTAKAIAKYPRERWIRVSEFQEKRKREIWGSA